MGRLFFWALVAVIAIYAFTPSNPLPRAAASPAAEPPEKPLVKRGWNTTFNGHTVSCGITGTERWQIMFPTWEEREEGAQPLIDRAPEDYVWAKACGPSDPG